MTELSVERISWALLIASLGLVSGRLVDKVVTKLLYRLTQRTKTELDDLIVEQLHRPVMRSTVLLGFYIALKVSGLHDQVANLLAHLIQTIAVLIWLFAAMPLAGLVFRWMSQHQTRFRAIQPASLPLFTIGSQVVLVSAAVYVGMQAWEIDIAAWVASAGILGLAVGFAARDTLANLFAGVSILADAPYKIGDYIVLIDGNKRGMVTQIGLRSTRILTRDDIEITIPNAAIANSTLVNESGWALDSPASSPAGLRGLWIGRGPGTRPAPGRGLRTNPWSAPNPPPRVRFREFGDSGLIFELLCWIAEAELQGRAIDALHTRSLQGPVATPESRFPFPQRDVNIRPSP